MGSNSEVSGAFALINHKVGIVSAEEGGGVSKVDELSRMERWKYSKAVLKKQKKSKTIR